jgi:hypothetical protein
VQQQKESLTKSIRTSLFYRYKYRTCTRSRQELIASTKNSTKYVSMSNIFKIQFRLLVSTPCWFRILCFNYKIQMFLVLNRRIRRISSEEVTFQFLLSFVGHAVQNGTSTNCAMCPSTSTSTWCMWECPSIPVCSLYHVVRSTTYKRTPSCCLEAREHRNDFVTVT